ncbi:MAG: hypothetical protein PUP90_18120 [Nostoc sp. S4]|nr:hypothetical protein [Nostoc sp. S4]
MTIVLSSDDWDELWYQQNQNPQSHSILLDEFETLNELPKCLGLSVFICWVFFKIIFKGKNQ